MIGLIQRVRGASVQIDGQRVGAIDGGVLALIAITHGDDDASGERLLQRILDYRIFADAAGRMNLSLRDIRGGLLLVPQFTLAADTRQGNRAGFSAAAPPERARPLFERLLARAQALHTPVQAGRFGAHMLVQLVNDGPVTFWLESVPAAGGAATNDGAASRSQTGGPQ